MKLKTLGLVALMAACKPLSANDKKDITISGRPLSVVYSPRTGPDQNYLVTILETDKEKIIAYKEGSGTQRNFQYSQAAALIQAEINDGDNEKIKLTGNYKNNLFEITSLETNGYWIRL